MPKDELPVLPFPSQATFEEWLEANHDAKRPETRRRRIEQFVAMLERGETVH